MTMSLAEKEERSQVQKGTLKERGQTGTLNLLDGVEAPRHRRRAMAKA